MGLVALEGSDSHPKIETEAPVASLAPLRWLLPAAVREPPKMPEYLLLRLRCTCEDERLS
jgi:hypothetical protein